MKYVFAAGFILSAALGVIATIIDLTYIYGVLTK